MHVLSYCADIPPPHQKKTWTFHLFSSFFFFFPRPIFCPKKERILISFFLLLLLPSFPTSVIFTRASSSSAKMPVPVRVCFHSGPTFTERKKEGPIWEPEEAHATSGKGEKERERERERCKSIQSYQTERENVQYGKNSRKLNFF